MGKDTSNRPRLGKPRDLPRPSPPDPGARFARDGGPRHRPARPAARASGGRDYRGATQQGQEPAAIAALQASGGSGCVTVPGERAPLGIWRVRATSTGEQASTTPTPAARPASARVAQRPRQGNGGDREPVRSTRPTTQADQPACDEPVREVAAIAAPRRATTRARRRTTRGARGRARGSSKHGPGWVDAWRSSTPRSVAARVAQVRRAARGSRITVRSPARQPNEVERQETERAAPLERPAHGTSAAIARASVGAAPSELSQVLSAF